MAKTVEVFIPPMLVWKKTYPRKPGRVIIRFKEIAESINYETVIEEKVASVGLEVV